MWGAIIGDIAGSIYEYDQIKKVKHIDCDCLTPENGFFSDDTILTIAVADALLNKKDFATTLRDYGKKYQSYKPNAEKYFPTTFSRGFTKWINGDFQGESAGNGAMMRISAVGFLGFSEEEVLENARLATIPSHNSHEAVGSAQKVALIIHYSKKGFSKDEIIQKLNIKIEYKPFEKFNYTCSETIGNCLYALFSSNSFDESVKKVISFGGDTDTNACIVGAMAEAMYGVDKKYIDFSRSKLPDEFCEILDRMYSVKSSFCDKE